MFKVPFFPLYLASNLITTELTNQVGTYCISTELQKIAVTHSIGDNCQNK